MTSSNGGDGSRIPESEDRLAPVIPLFGDRSAPPTRPEAPASVSHVHPSVASSWHATWADDPADGPRGVDIDAVEPAGESAAAQRETAEKSLLRKLRTRSLSVREARTAISGPDVPSEVVDAVIDSVLRLGYLDDAALAEQIIHTGVDRKGQGRQLIAQTMAKRGIPRDVADAAVATLPDDDADRALEFARTKARSLSSLDHDTALRRLIGQLARRGYGGSAAMAAAKQALTEAGSSPSSGVRFR